MDLVFAGIQGSGKGTQAKRLAAEYNYVIFEAGHELRSIAKTDTDLGKEVASYVNNGLLVPPTIILNVAKVAIENQVPNQKILFDGIPRDEEQMNMFNAIMQAANREFKIIHFNLTEEIALERIAGRAIAENRVDDADSTKVRSRLGWFYEKNVPVIEEYRTQGKVTDIEANQPIEAIYQELLAAVL
jgi:adenylate kinase